MNIETGTFNREPVDERQKVAVQIIQDIYTFMELKRLGNDAMHEVREKITGDIQAFGGKKALELFLDKNEGRHSLPKSLAGLEME